MAIAAAPGCGFNSNSAKPGPDSGVDGPGGTTGDDGGPPPDGRPPDGPPSGNLVCYGPSGWEVCLDARASGPVQLQGTLDTDRNDAASPCLKNQPSGWTTAQPEACIVVGGTVSVTSLSVTGTRPLVLVAETSITVTGLLDVASHRSQNVVGAGASTATCAPFVAPPGIGPSGAGGGAGGSFMFAGGTGGTGDGVNQAGGQAAAGLGDAPSRLRGGCAGQPGGGGSANDGGAGGGAVYLVSAGTISVTGKIDVSGAGGKGRNAEHGGGGGGSGGMIVLHAASIATMQGTLLIADGGGGGGGSSAHDTSQQTTNGDDGHEPILQTSIVPALGGAGGIGTMGFNGGAGGNGYPALSNTMPGLKGEAGDTSSGGGGGGGGGGYIRSNHALGITTVLPAADIKP
jgi:hypothetical protein